MFVVVGKGVVGNTFPQRVALPPVEATCFKQIGLAQGFDSRNHLLVGGAKRGLNLGQRLGAVGFNQACIVLIYLALWLDGWLSALRYRLILLRPDFVPGG